MSPADRLRAARHRARIRDAGDGPIVAVTSSPEGPPCTIVVIGGPYEGQIIHGYRVSDDFAGCQSIVVYRGRCVHAVYVNDLGTELTTPDGKAILEHVGDGKLRQRMVTDRPITLQIRPQRAPEPHPARRKP